MSLATYLLKSPDNSKNQAESLKNSGPSFLSLTVLGYSDKRQGGALLFNGQIILWAAYVPFLWLCNLF